MAYSSRVFDFFEAPPTFNLTHLINSDTSPVSAHDYDFIVNGMEDSSVYFGPLNEGGVWRGIRKYWGGATLSYLNVSNANEYGLYLYSNNNIYITEIYQNYECDTFFPDIKSDYSITNVSKFKARYVRYRRMAYLLLVNSEVVLTKYINRAR